ncbi:hypothetical protein PCANC_07590 [Puccinia coronata f. sp. avenae]|uniref:Uncharacterized protein n=1 Tax=Puccinia coronata f. sp. avenae TaxID=200324 RepID=A0A2N5VK71_9BASI|nr:hypothetical protein PCASD_05991 [Puccinia coronata f. sp. avenae]PLW50387.1 hypothetical protein PCANC_07590 [Puccinia coronata f. sp. avenae]
MALISTTTSPAAADVYPSFADHPLGPSRPSPIDSWTRIDHVPQSNQLLSSSGPAPPIPHHRRRRHRHHHQPTKHHTLTTLNTAINV